jgi:hypothetical protein
LFEDHNRSHLIIINKSIQYQKLLLIPDDGDVHDVHDDDEVVTIISRVSNIDGDNNNVNDKKII